MQTNPTRQDNVLDLYFTNIPSLVKSCETIPGISDHDMLVIDSDLKPTYNKPKRRKVYIYKMYKRADMNTIKQNMTEQSENIINTDADSPINDIWEKLKHGIYEVMEKNIPSKLTSNIHNLPWINHKLKKKMIKKKNKLYNKARQSKKKEDWDYYKVHKRHTQKALRQAHWEHVNTILEDSLESGNRKPFWKYIKAKKKDNIGMAPINDKGQLYSDSPTKAELLNKQFKSVFTQEKTDEPLPKIPGKEYTKINRLDITTAGVQKLLANLDTKRVDPMHYRIK